MLNLGSKDFFMTRMGYSLDTRCTVQVYTFVVNIPALFRLFPSASLLVAHLGLNPVRVS